MLSRFAGPLVLVACTSATVAPRTLRISTGEAVARCESVGVIDERIESPLEREELKTEVRAALRERATKLKATDLVVRKEEYEDGYAHATAEAFRCKK